MNHAGSRHEGRQLPFNPNQQTLPFQRRPKRPYEPRDSPKTKHALPGAEPWLLVKTKLGRRFVHNPRTKESFWRVPDDLRSAVERFDDPVANAEALNLQSHVGVAKIPSNKQQETQPPAVPDGEDVVEGDKPEYGSEYEEVEVTDDEDEGDNAGVASALPQGDPVEALSGPQELGEDDMEYQLAALEAEADAATDYEEDHPDDTLTEYQATSEFKSLLSSIGVTPFVPFDHLLSIPAFYDNPRYTLLPSMKARKAVWQEWAKQESQMLKQQRQGEDKQDPETAYIEFLRLKASPKLFWQEFKRKYKAEKVMKDLRVSEREKEKLYREFVAQMGVARRRP